MPSPKLTRAQRRELLLITEKGFIPWFTSYRSMPRHKCYHALMDMGLVEFSPSPLGYRLIPEEERDDD